MEDTKIVDLFWQRDQAAIRQADQKYGKYCYAIAYGILASREDSEECVSDTWHNAWQAMPPERPTRLQAFLGRITRNLALDRYGYNHAQKRNVHLEAVMDEYWQCIPNGDMPLDDQVALKALINGFLGSLDKQTRVIFLRRYYYICSVKDIARSMGLSESNVSVILHRTRTKFKEYLQKEGISV